MTTTLLQRFARFATFLLGIRICSKCNNQDQSTFRPVELDDDKLTFKECTVCHTLHGADDTFSQEGAKKWLQSLPVKICPCGNTDKEKYRFREKNVEIVLQCDVCLKEFPLSPGAQASVSGATGSGNKAPFTHASGELECQCGNKDNEQFELHMLDETVKSIQCLKCHVYVSTQTPNDYKDFESDGLAGDTSHEMASTSGEYVAMGATDTTFPVESHKTGAPSDSIDTDTYYDAKSSPENMDETPPETYESGKIRQAEIVGKKAVTHARELSMGDHIAWWKAQEHYWHHALVKQVHEDSNAITAIHCADTNPSKAKVKGQIMEAYMDLDKESGVLYLMVYTGPCLSAESSLYHAKKRLGETTYTFFITNEEFVRSCKSDAMISERVMGALKQNKKYFKMVLQGVLTTWRAIDDATKVKPLNIGMEPAIILIEIGETMMGIESAKEKRRTGHITRGQFINIVIESTSRVILSGSGTIVGYVAGPALLPVAIPISAGAFIGSTLGYYLGIYASPKIAEGVVKYMEPGEDK